MQHVIEACKSSIPREASFNNLIHTIGRVMIIYNYAVAIGPVIGSVSCGYGSGSLIYDTLRMSTRRFVDLEI